MFSSFSMDGSEDVGEAFSMVTKMFLRIAPFLSTVRTWIFLSSSPGFFLSVFAIFVGFYDKSLFPGFLERESRILVVEKGTERGKDKVTISIPREKILIGSWPFLNMLPFSVAPSISEAE
ncbi:hypothetical protein SADUNF_Sadunf17G0078400 [Salix dunnii]|uniref:Uncharacterized protein n=1 Tax=Salix dunnii TaxID=1413687 RepID=A0A835J606_9ROSI|nr:hypothetical protein SADUNF_Sadunf17G0078400 [Salix dunnii]